MNDILDLSKFECGKMNFDMQKVDMKQLVENVMMECKDLYNNSSLNIKTYIQPDINFDVKADAEKIMQVLRNILNNAFKFTQVGTISVYLQKQGYNIEVIVRDDGIGIPDNELELIFNSFMQSRRTRSKAGGTGLGLAICREIITKHNGTIWAVNNQGKGTSFHFLIPKYDNENKASSKANKNHGNVLVVDDDHTCHNILGLILKAENYKMISVYGGEEALEYLQKNHQNVDLILLDLMMPDIYGLNVLKTIKADTTLQNIPVIIQSASHDKMEHERAIQLGAESFVEKPYDRVKLSGLLSKHIKTNKI